MSDEITKLKQKITELEFKLNVKTLDLKKCQAKLAEQKATHKIQMLDSKEKASEGIDIAPILEEAKERMKNIGKGKNPP